MLTLKETQSCPNSGLSSLPLNDMKDDSNLLLEQEYLWEIEKSPAATSANNLSLALFLEGSIDSRALKDSFAKILHRHVLLRTRIVESTVPNLVIGDMENLNLPFVEQTSSDLPRKEVISSLVESEVGKKFDLTQEFPIRGKLLRFDLKKHLLIITIHRIAANMNLVGVIQQELSTLYNAHTQGEQSLLQMDNKSGGILQEQIPDDVLKTQLEFWEGQLADLNHATLPVDKVRLPTPVHRAFTEHICLPEVLTNQLVQISVQNQTSLFSTLLSAIQILLYHLTNTTDNALASNLDFVKTQENIGLYNTTQIIRSEIRDDKTFTQHLGEVEKRLSDILQHRGWPWQKLMSEFRADNAEGHKNLEVFFDLHDWCIGNVQMENLTVSAVEGYEMSTMYELEIHVWKVDKHLKDATNLSTTTGICSHISFSTSKRDQSLRESGARELTTELE
ncbi:hypothetical protein K7432_015039 [Basidiobolus ranarum]|uniref:Condensation domain-containing protein n=1 Tax=Basidiobolus ranarum TaxID=34480 RepID=A0ABR2WGP9_9FUNG